MKKLFISVVSLLFFVSMSGSVFAELNGELYKMAKYQSESKNPTVAVLGSWIFPSVGHAYAGDWFRGLPFLAMNVGLSVVMMSGGGSAIITSSYVVTRTWEYIDAYSTAEDSNHKLAKSLSLAGNASLVSDTIFVEDVSQKVEPATALNLDDRFIKLEKKIDSKLERILKHLSDDK